MYQRKCIVNVKKKLNVLLDYSFPFILITFIYANRKDKNKANEQNEADVLHSLSVWLLSQ